jgi:hypothetical protein
MACTSVRFIEGVQGPPGIGCERIVELCSERLIENAPSLERVVLFRMSHSQIVEVLRIQRTAGRALLQQLKRRKRIRFVRNLALREVGRAQNLSADFHGLSTRDHKLHRAFRRSARKGMRDAFAPGRNQRSAATAL